MKKLSSEIEKIKLTEEGKKISNILDTYLDKIKKINDGNGVIKAQQESIFLRPIRKAFGKVFSTVYLVFSLPANILNELSIAFTKNKVDKFDDIADEVIEKSYKKELAELGKLCLNEGKSPVRKFVAKYAKVISENEKTPKWISKRAKKIYDNTVKNPNEIAKTIKDRTRKVGDVQETGQLALISRTFVTILSSYFFVNDYYNEALIKSEGKDVEGAKVKRKEKIGHKVINFITNSPNNN